MTSTYNLVESIYLYMKDVSSKKKLKKKFSMKNSFLKIFGFLCGCGFSWFFGIFLNFFWKIFGKKFQTFSHNFFGFFGGLICYFANIGALQKISADRTCFLNENLFCTLSEENFILIFLCWNFLKKIFFNKFLKNFQNCFLPVLPTVWRCLLPNLVINTLFFTKLQGAALSRWGYSL